MTSSTDDTAFAGEAVIERVTRPGMLHESLPERHAGRPADTRPAPRCSSCPVRGLCLPSALTSMDFRQLDALICTTRIVRRGDALYRVGDAFESLYAVRSGCFKTVVRHRDGQEQITGFHIAGEPLGLDGIGFDEQHADAIALEDSTVCVIPFAQMEILCRDIRALQQHVHRMLSGEIVRGSGLAMLLGTMTAEQRVAAFLTNLSARMSARGYSGTEFQLRMTRAEMASYLGLKLETVSRMLSKMQKDGVVDISGKRVKITERAQLIAV